MVFLLYARGNTLATVSIKMDDITKTKFSEFCESVGLTTSAAINMFAKRVVRDNKIPFEITGNLEPTEHFLAAVKEAREITETKLILTLIDTGTHSDLFK